MKGENISPKSKRSLLIGIRFVAWVVSGAMLWLTLSPGAPSGPSMFSGVDKLWHVLAFFGWALLITIGWRWSLWIVLICGAVFGGAIEVIQPFVGRGAELADLFADVLGAGIGGFMGVALRSQIHKRLEPQAT